MQAFVTAYNNVGLASTFAASLAADAAMLERMQERRRRLARLAADLRRLMGQGGGRARSARAPSDVFEAPPPIIASATVPTML